jgi:hypothetical protein
MAPQSGGRPGRAHVADRNRHGAGTWAGAFHQMGLSDTVGRDKGTVPRARCRRAWACRGTKVTAQAFRQRTPTPRIPKVLRKIELWQLGGTRAVPQSACVLRKVEYWQLEGRSSREKLSIGNEWAPSIANTPLSSAPSPTGIASTRLSSAGFHSNALRRG